MNCITMGWCRSTSSNGGRSSNGSNKNIYSDSTGQNATDMFCWVDFFLIYIYSIHFSLLYREKKDEKNSNSFHIWKKTEKTTFDMLDRPNCLLLLILLVYLLISKIWFGIVCSFFSFLKNGRIFFGTISIVQWRRITISNNFEN